jgi:hypothetical protein
LARCTCSSPATCSSPPASPPSVTSRRGSAWYGPGSCPRMPWMDDAVLHRCCGDAQRWSTAAAWCWR